MYRRDSTTRILNTRGQPPHFPISPLMELPQTGIISVVRGSNGFPMLRSFYEGIYSTSISLVSLFTSFITQFPNLDFRPLLFSQPLISQYQIYKHQHTMHFPTITLTLSLALLGVHSVPAPSSPFSESNSTSNKLLTARGVSLRGNLYPPQPPGSYFSSLSYLYSSESGAPKDCLATLVIPLKE